jgi:Mrp family chromosome partitioning ATPase
MRSTTDGLTANNPDRIYVEHRMDAMKKYDLKLREEVSKTAHGIVYGKQNIEMRKSAILARNDFEKAKKTEEALKRELDNNLKESKRISIGIRRGEYLSTNLKHKHDLLDNLDTRITEIEVERKAPLRLSVESVARTPSAPLKSNAKNVAMALLAVSFGLVGGVFFVIEYTDGRIRTTKDVRNALGSPPTQVIENVRDRRSGNIECSLAPEDFRSDDIGSLAIRFCREQEQSNTRVILFTGVENGSGTTSIAYSCARALSRISGRVLLIDGNIAPSKRGGEQDSVAGSAGLCGYLANGGPWRDHLVPATEGNVDVMHAGRMTAEGMPRQRVRELLGEARQEYDFICIDGAPLLQSHLTEQMAIYSDIVVLISLKDSSSYTDLYRAAELLVRLGVPGIAPILNNSSAKKRVSLGDLLKSPPEPIMKRLPDKLVELLRKMSAHIRAIDRIINSLQGA